ncbi:hypothetical protein COLINT_02948 [Collinsella intestinalis DSM 13280]|uniref:Uncharacterized protein n=1 Tax=Collinsella intestinalis DSM 13280 TaxID=521003 RepID=C4FA56_9ACTN|nr:hypothetical protein COLINT_02948 [Collinsella intestinalis DSM 13280]
MEDMNDSVVHILQKVPVETQTIPAMSGQRAMAGGQNPSAFSAARTSHSIAACRPPQFRDCPSIEVQQQRTPVGETTLRQ